MKPLFRTILVPHDFSTHASQALCVAVELAAAHGGRVIVLHAIAPFYPPEGMIAWVPEADLIADARANLEAEIARTVGRRRLRIDRRVVVGVPVQRILEAAREAGCIVMATRGRTGLSHLVIGSVAEKVVRHSPVPVLTIRPAGKARTIWERPPVRAARQAAGRRAG